LATDFDGPGTEGYFEIKEALKLAFSGIEIFGVHELLPPDVRELAYPYDQDLFTSAGPHFGEKQDMNELLLRPELRHYRYFPPEMIK
jgi:hypothetical protein